jgi:hypothetical protein
MATIDEFALKNIGLWWRYGISRHCDEWKYIIIGRIFESEIILIPPSLKISESSSNGSYRNTDEVWWRYGISRSCDECTTVLWDDIHIKVGCINLSAKKVKYLIHVYLKDGKIMRIKTKLTFTSNLQVQYKIWF